MNGTNYIPSHYRQFMPGVGVTPVNEFTVDGFAGLDGIGKKLKKAAKKFSAPVKRIGQKIAKVDPVLRTIKKVGQPIAKKAVREASRVAKSPVVQMATAAMLPIMAAPGLVDKGFRKNTAPIYGAYGVAAGAGGAGFAVTGGGAESVAEELIETVSNNPTIMEQFTGGGNDGESGSGEDFQNELPVYEAEEPLIVEGVEPKPVVPLAFVGVALSALSFFK